MTRATAMYDFDDYIGKHGLISLLVNLSAHIDQERRKNVDSGTFDAMELLKESVDDFLENAERSDHEN